MHWLRRMVLKTIISKEGYYAEIGMPFRRVPYAFWPLSWDEFIIARTVLKGKTACLPKISKLRGTTTERTLRWHNGVHRFTCALCLFPVGYPGRTFGGGNQRSAQSLGHWRHLLLRMRAVYVHYEGALKAFPFPYAHFEIRRFKKYNEISGYISSGDVVFGFRRTLPPDRQAALLSTLPVISGIAL